MLTMEINSDERITWYDGDSTMLHLEQKDETGTWQEANCCTLRTMPTRMKDMMVKMQEAYDSMVS